MRQYRGEITSPNQLIVIEIKMTLGIYLMSQFTDPLQYVVFTCPLFKEVIMEMFITNIPLNESVEEKTPKNCITDCSMKTS